jgi:hypothetical protein
MRSQWTWKYSNGVKLIVLSPTAGLTLFLGKMIWTPADQTQVDRCCYFLRSFYKLFHFFFENEEYFTGGLL